MGSMAGIPGMIIGAIAGAIPGIVTLFEGLDYTAAERYTAAVEKSAKAQEEYIKAQAKTAEFRFFLTEDKTVKASGTSKIGF